MNYSKKILTVAVLAAGVFLLDSCGSGGGGGKSTGADEEALREYLGSEEIRSDLDNLAEFAFYSEYLQTAPIAFMAGDDGLFTDNVDEDEANEYADVMAKVLSKIDDYEEAWARIDSMQALVTETPNSLKKIGLVYAMRDFFRSLRGCGKGTREKAMAVAGELDKSELKTLFDGLDPNQKRGETDHLTWWKNFNNGDYDDISLQIYNRMYYNTETSFADEAEFINKTVAKTGAELSKKASEFQVEILKAALPAPVTDAMDKMETLDKVNTIVTKGKDMTAEELKDNLGSLLVDGYDDVKKVSEMAGEDVEAISNMTKKVINKVTASSEESSVVTFADKASSAMDGGKIAIAIASATGKITIALGANENGDHQLTLDEEGGHLVSFLNTLGDKFTQKLDVVKGKFYELVGEMNEKAIRDSLAKSSSSSKTSKSSSSVKPKSSSSAKVNKDSKSVVGKWVSVKETMAHNITNYDECYAMWGPSDGLEDMSEEECSNHEYDVDYALGQTVIFYSDGSVDHLDANGDVDASYSYTFDKSTGTLSYSYDGVTYTASVSADGTTMTMQTVTDIHYGEIIHKIILEKVSDDVED